MNNKAEKKDMDCKELITSFPLITLQTFFHLSLQQKIGHYYSHSQVGQLIAGNLAGKPAFWAFKLINQHPDR